MRQYFAQLLRLIALASLLSGAIGFCGATAVEAEAAHVHTVEPGETLRSIADLYGVSPRTVLAANSIDDADMLRVGQQLTVPSVDGVLHTVADGETLGGIATTFGVSTSDLVSANALGDTPDLLSVGTVLVVPGVNPATVPPAQRTATVSAPETNSGTYTVRDGDTLHSVAERFDIDIMSLININGLSDPNLLTPGSTLRVSAKDAVEHVVAPGETLGDIAWNFSVDSSALLAANALEDPNRIVVGTTLVIPTAGAPKPAAAPRAQAAAPTPVPAAPTPAPQPRSAPAPRPAAPAPQAAPANSPGNVVTARVTGYAPGAGAVSSKTSSGTTTHWGTAAADTRLYPYGTRVRIEGLGDTVFVVEDTGSAVRGNVFDVWFPDAASARQLGARTRQITILGPGDN